MVVKNTKQLRKLRIPNWSVLFSQQQFALLDLIITQYDNCKHQPRQQHHNLTSSPHSSNSHIHIVMKLPISNTAKTKSQRLIYTQLNQSKIQLVFGWIQLMNYSSLNSYYPNKRFLQSMSNTIHNIPTKG